MTDKNLEPHHLGDGAYCTLDGYGGAVLTANHHDPNVATDTVYLDSYALSAFFRIAKKDGFLEDSKQ